jgi:hypothetical protein
MFSRQFVYIRPKLHQDYTESNSLHLYRIVDCVVIQDRVKIRHIKGKGN